jgi:hypothetical protein
MAVIEIREFRLAAGVGEDAFLDADRRAQSAFWYQQRGLLRRTTARGTDGGWIVVSLWSSRADADASAAASHEDAAASAMASMWEPSSTTVRHYDTLD